MRVSEQATRLTFKDPVSATTHFLGLLLGLAGLVLWLPGVVGPERFTAATLYGASLVLLFLASSTYHFFDLGTRGNAWLQRIDHAAIYLFIAGSYLPILVVCLSGTSRVVMLTLVLGLAVVGAVVKLCGVRLPDRVDTALYLALGWIVVLAARDVFAALSAGQFALLLTGGLSYTLGAVVYARERPDPWPGVFGHHEVWHLFVLLGAGAHFASVASLLA